MGDPSMLHSLIGFALAGKGCGESHGMSAHAGAAEDIQKLESLLPLLHRLEPTTLHALLIEVLDDIDRNSSVASMDSSAACDNLPTNPLEALCGAFNGVKGYGKGGNADCSADHQPQHNPLQGLLNTLLLSKGIGKGEAAQVGTASGTPQPNPLEGFLGSLLAGKGFGKGGGAQDVAVGGLPPLNPIEAMLGAFMQGKGCGKGYVSTEPKPEPCATPTSDAATNSQEPVGTVGSRAVFEESVKD